MDVFGFFCQPVQLFDGNSQQDGHLVQESPGTAGAVAVHAQVAAAILFNVDNFGVFAADVDQGCSFRIFGFHEFGGRDHFLHKRQVEFLCNAHAHRSGDLQFQAGAADLGTEILQFFPQDAGHIGLVPFVPGEYHMGMVVQHHDFTGGGSDV